MNYFSGSQLIDWLIKFRKCTRQSAIVIGNELVKFGFIHHTVDLEKPLLDGYFFYVFTVR